MYAYAACLNLDEICTAAIKTLEAPNHIRRAIIIRLVRTGETGQHQDTLDRFSQELTGRLDGGTKIRRRIDALLSELYLFFSPPARKQILDRWRGRGTREAGARWLKAVSSDDIHYSDSDILSYYREAFDPRAARVIARNAPPKLLGTILHEIAESCDEGWTVSRAALRADTISENCWQVIRNRLPSSYAYLCAKLGRNMGNDEALSIFYDELKKWPSDGAGLVIWAMGQLKMWRELEEILTSAPTIEEMVASYLELNSQQ